MTRAFLLASAMAFVSVSAIASDLPNKNSAPKFVPKKSWDGLYLGVHGGFGSVSSTATDETGEEFGAPGSSGDVGAQYSIDDSNALVGLSVGYNIQNGNFVFGPEVDLSYMKTDKLALFDQTESDEDPGLLLSYKGFNGFAGVRLGYLISEPVLAYVKLGAVAAKIRNAGGEYDGFVPPDNNGIWGFDGNESAGGEETRYGYGVGAGIEYSINTNWSVKAEYMYSSYKNKTYDWLVEGEGEQPFTFEDDMQSIKVGLNYRFAQ